MARRKFKFVEMFIDPSTGAPYENTGSPKLIKPKNFPQFMGHQIARIEYEEKKIKDVTYTIKDGKSIKGDETEITILVEKMGEKGGWIEQMSNLSQDGDCWVSNGGIVCGNGYVGDDVRLSSGEVGENARVCGSAKIGGEVGIGGNAYVYGNAFIGGSARIAVKGTARVCGKVSGQAVVEGSAYVGEKGSVGGNAVVKGNAQVFGKVEGNAVVMDAATVYGTVKGKSTVSYEAIILESGTVDGKAVVESGIVGGMVKGEVAISYGQVFVAEGGSLEGKASVSGNAFVQCRASDDVQITENGSAYQDGSVSGGAISANGAVRGTSEKFVVGGTSVVVGSAGGGGTMNDGARVGENGKLSGTEVSGSANIGGTTSSEMQGNSVVAPAASATMELSGNEVYLDGDDKEPQPTGEDEAPYAVICTVEKE